MIKAIVPAKSWSTGLPNKNVADFCGKPLFLWTLEYALKSNVDRVYLMTDSDYYKSISPMETYILEEPPKDDRDGEHLVYGILPAIKDWDDDDIIVLLQPTSPLRNAAHINEALRLFKKNTLYNVISVTDAPPIGSIRHSEDGFIKPIVNSNPNFVRQDMPKHFLVNGAIYISRVGRLREEKTFHISGTIAYYMQPIYSIDINDQNDLLMARAVQKEYIGWSD